MFAFLVIACIIIGYLLGAFPTSYLIGKYWGKVNLLEQGESHVSATAVYRELGWGPFLIVLVIDLIKGMLAIYISHVLTGNIWLVAVTAVAALVGHCWSVFIKFHGGLGATIIFGMLFCTGVLFSRMHIPWEYALGGVTALITMLTVKKSSLSTILWLVIISVTLFIELFGFSAGTLAMALLPIMLLTIQFIKQRVSHRRGDAYKNELVSDFKRVKRT
jgi:acyl phosphate:glycerol-3-phosphate acyltransferase